MIITRFFFLATTGVVTLFLAACANSDTAAKKPAKKVYYAHNVQTGSHLQRAYTDPNESSDAASNVATGSPSAGDRPFVNSSAGGSYNGAH